MKFLFAGSVALLIAASVPQTSHAAVFAAHLEMINNGNGTFNLNYRLNEEANTGVTIHIKGPAPLETVVRTLTFPNQAAGAQSVVWDGKNNAAVAVPDGTYTWEVVASTNNTAGTPYVVTKDGTAKEHTFYLPFGLDVDKTTTSPHFGKVYVSELGGDVAANDRVTQSGIYILGNDLSDITNQGDNAYGTDVNWVDPTIFAASPYRVHVAPDSDVFVTDASTTNSGVWIMDPDNPEAPFSELFDNSSRDPATGLTNNHGQISSVYVEGAGEDRVLYTFDRNYIDGAGTERYGSIWAYNIGEIEAGYAAKPTIVYDDAANGNALINFTGKIEKDTHSARDGWWISQNRYEETAANPSVFHYNGTEIDWKSSVDFPGEFTYLNHQGSFDLNSDGTRLAIAAWQYIQVTDVSDLNNEQMVYIDAGTASSHRDIVFDPADNMILGSSVAEKILYYSKQGSNTFTTPNPLGSEIVIGDTSVSGWELY